MLEKIFIQLKNSQENTVEFSKVYNFFQKCTLFLNIYNISLAQVQEILKSSSQTYSNKLTKEEFLEFFLINCPNRKYKQPQSKINKICCLEQQNWSQLKKIFDQLDTFGDGNVKTAQFFHKMKTISVSKQLMQANTLHFPTLNKFYSFQKIIFVLEHKKTLPQILKWKQLEHQIINFQHIDYPTIDQIFAENIKKATIIQGSSAFLLKQEVLSVLKQEFEKCPKFSKHFVKCKYFCQQLLTTESFKKYMKQYVRKDSSMTKQVLITIKQNIRILQTQGPQYFDMDQMLEYFSVKGFEKYFQNKKFQQKFELQSNSSQEAFEQRKRQKVRQNRMKSQDHMKKIMENTGKYKSLDKKRIIIQPTSIEEFNLSKKRDHLTIRQKKVQQMLQEKESKQIAQIKPYVKANPIPTSINCQKYQQQQKNFQSIRQIERYRKQKKRDQDQKKLLYLMSNTKLFEKKDPLKLQEQKRKYLLPQQKQVFQAKPISWFVRQTNLLEAIEGEKQERRKNRLKETKEKYVYGYWKNMPYEGFTSPKKLTIQKCLQNKDDSLELQIKDINKTFVQYQKPRIKVNPVPDFAKLQKQFKEELESRKQMKSPTVVKQFNLSMSKKKQPLQIQQVKENAKKCKKVCETKSIIQEKQTQPIIIGTTRKFESMVELNQKKKVEKQLQVYRKIMEEEQRKSKQKIFAKFMKKAWNQDMKKTKKSSNNTKRKSKNTITRITHEADLKKIYQRVLQRPFLFQTATQNQRNPENSKRSSTKPTKIPKSSLATKHIPKKVIIPKEQQQFFEQNQGYYLNQVQEQSYFEEEQSQQYYSSNQGKGQNNFYIDLGKNEGNGQGDYYGEESEENEGQYDNSDQEGNKETIRNFHNQSF